MKKRNIPFGYQWENGVITAHPTESKIVIGIFTAYITGRSLLQIAEALNKNSIEYLPGVIGWNKARLKRMIEDARSQAITIASEQEIVRISQQQADTILADARELERQTRAGAEDYADEVFGHVEQSLDTLLGNVRRCRDRLNAGSTNVGRG